MGLPGLDLLWVNIVLSVAICTVLLSLAYRNRILDRSGTLLAFGIGVVVGGLGQVSWLAVLLIFLFTAYVATKYRYLEKKKRKVAQTGGGRRGAENVLANGWIPAVIAALTYPYPTPFALDRTWGALLFLTAISVAASDTFASELGVFAKDAHLITNPAKKVPIGTNGGVSALGQGAAILGAGVVTASGWVLLTTLDTSLAGLSPLWALLPFGVGFIGCQLDSVLGSLLENKGHLNGSQVNLASIALGVFIALPVVYLYV